MEDFELMKNSPYVIDEFGENVTVDAILKAHINELDGNWKNYLTLLHHWSLRMENTGYFLSDFHTVILAFYMDQKGYVWYKGKFVKKNILVY